ATLLWIEADGHPDHAETTPVDLCWMHQPPGTPPEMCWDDVASADIAFVVARGRATERLVFARAAFQPHVLLRPSQEHYREIVFCIRVTVLGTKKSYERAFTLEPDAARPLGLRPCPIGSSRARHSEERLVMSQRILSQRLRNGPTSCWRTLRAIFALW